VDLGAYEKAKHEGKNPIGKHRHRCENNIKIDLKGTGLD
jgi:hypothetical protein